MKNNEYKFRIYQSKEKYYAQKLVKGWFRMKWKHVEYYYYPECGKTHESYSNIDDAIKAIVEYLRYSLLPTFKIIKQFTQNEILSLLESNS